MHELPVLSFYAGVDRFPRTSRIRNLLKDILDQCDLIWFHRFPYLSFPGRAPLQSKILPFSPVLILMRDTWQIKNLMVKTSKHNLLLCSNAFQLPPLQTLSLYITALGSIWLEAIGNSAGNLGVTGVIPKSSWCYISSASKKKKKNLKKIMWKLPILFWVISIFAQIHKNSLWV